MKIHIVYLNELSQEFIDLPFKIDEILNNM